MRLTKERLIVCRGKCFYIQQEQSRPLLKDWFNGIDFNLMPLIHRFVFVPPEAVLSVLWWYSVICISPEFPIWDLGMRVMQTNHPQVQGLVGKLQATMDF